MATIKELSILRQNGEEVTLTFTSKGVLKKRNIEGKTEEENKETIYLHKNPLRYVDIITDTLSKENINNAIAISGIFVEDDGSVIEQEGLLGSIFYENDITEEVRGI